MNLKSILLACGLVLLMTLGARANNMLVQNVTTLGNDAVNKTIQVQFDISWDNSWRDAINYDAAWIFMKFKDANGLWQHVQLNQTGLVNGTGTANTVQVTSDKVGSWLYRSALGSGTFNSTGMQLQWNYGLAGLNNVTGLEVRVFAVEMVYVPEGDFNVAKGFWVLSADCCPPGDFNGSFNAPGSNFPVINTRLTPTLIYSDGSSASLRIKGDAGMDTNNDGDIDNTTYPTGYNAFYCYKYELTNQQYADFLNTLTTTQISTLGVAGTGITFTNDQYFASTPNVACGNANASRLFAYADWSGIRPMSFLEFNKATYGPLQPVYIDSYPVKGYVAGAARSSLCCGYEPYAEFLTNAGSYATESSDRSSSGATFYGCLDFTGNSVEPIVKLNSYDFTELNGNGILTSSGNSDISTWLSDYIIFADQFNGWSRSNDYYGFRYVRSAE